MEEPATDDAHMWGMPLQPLGQAQRDPPPSFHVATSQDFAKSNGRRSVDNFVGVEDKLDLDILKSSLSEFEQHKKVEAARARREGHLQQKVCQASVRNTSTAHKTFEVLQQQWAEGVTRDEYANLLRHKHDEALMLKRVQRGLLQHLREGQLNQGVAARERIQETKKEAHWHFQSLQTLFDDRVRTLRGQELELRVSQEEDVGSYRRLHDQLRQFDLLKQRKILDDNKKMLQQKRLYSAQMRQESHQQLLSYLAAGEAWEHSLRASWPPPPTPSSATRALRGGSPSPLLPRRRQVYAPKARTNLNRSGGKKHARPKSATTSHQHRSAINPSSR